jgi:integrase
MAKWEEFKKWMIADGGYSRQTVEQYSCVARLFETFAEVKGGGRPLREVLIDFLSTVDDRSKPHYKTAVKKFLRFIGERELADEIRAGSRPISQIEWFWSEDDVRRIINACRNVRERLIVKFAYYQAMRRKEILSLTLDDIDLDGKKVRVRLAKKRGTRFLVKDLYDDQVEDLKQYIRWKGLKSGDRLFNMTPVRLHGIFKQIVKRAGVKEAGIHALRHARAAHLRMKGVPLDVLSSWLGHEGLNATMIYAHIGPQTFSKEILPPLV